MIVIPIHPRLGVQLPFWDIINAPNLTIASKNLFLTSDYVEMSLSLKIMLRKYILIPMLVRQCQ